VMLRYGTTADAEKRCDDSSYLDLLWIHKRCAEATTESEHKPLLQKS